MIRHLLRSFVMAAVLFAAVFGTANDAKAGWWNSCGSYGGWGYGGGYAGYGYGGYGGWGYGGYGYDGWGYGGWGYGDYGYGGYGWGNGGWGYSGYYGPWASNSTPSSSMIVSAAVDSNTAVLKVNVPEDAKVYVDDYLTKSKGATRRFEKRDLEKGKTYQLAVRAEMMRDGQLVTKTKNIVVQGGRTSDLAFNLRAPANPVTTLTVKVPEDAKVYLMSAETKATGKSRVFQSKQLRAGQEWSDYQVMVTVKRNGRLLTREQSITLKGGEKRDLTIDLDRADLAAVQ